MCRLFGEDKPEDVVGRESLELLPRRMETTAKARGAPRP